MDTQLAGLVALVFGLTASIRAAMPQIDGRRVVVLVAGLALLVTVASVPELTIATLRATLLLALKVAVGAIGAAGALNYGAAKLGAAMAPTITLPPEAPEDERPTKQPEIKP